ncbi:hypothetical protein [Catellatospora citrea]|uniref:SCO6045-like C-terminal domain-containing protein n=1 Tax=Catellatospora citrea TaxID=53366 RepID=A0A8J3NY91_9ACTN|nr:hypothetical protein [Catellatospora citrea]RKE06925.1 hypothetical protein C8E86_1749 [Catellatospora citrea]GIF95075.1 hypothetical protein Cci01nite_01690 [Catellatospora citrea]
MTGDRDLGSADAGAASHRAVDAGAASDRAAEFGAVPDGAVGGGLARRQEELVRALVAGAGVPAGFDAAAVAATQTALLRKRAEDVARTWPRLAASAGPGQWARTFSAWAAGRAPQGSLRDGWDYARAHPSRDAAAVRELALRELLWAYDGETAPRPRRGPAARLHAGELLLRWRGRTLTYRLR